MQMANAKRIDVGLVSDLNSKEGTSVGWAKPQLLVPYNPYSKEALGQMVDLACQPELCAV
jgi:hypothetical protein